MIKYLIGFVFLSLFALPSAPNKYLPSNLELKGHESLTFCRDHGYDTTWAILIDMSIHSGKPRLFAYDLQNQTILSQGLCSHGCGAFNWGDDQTKTNPSFSNLEDSHKSSLGKYKVGKRGWSNWGIHVNYKLHGLENSNSNAFDRLIVLHSWEAVPDTNLYPSGTPEGWGCPAVSNTQMKWLDEKIKISESPVLMWIYN